MHFLSRFFSLPQVFSQWLSWYLNRRMAWVILIGMLSGYPWALFGTLLTLRLQDAGLSRGSIGLFGLVALAYALNLLWAPLIDAFRLPLPVALQKLGGRRKSWILICHLAILMLAGAIAIVPIHSEGLPLLALLCVLMAFAGATQDVAIDALRIELIDADESEKIAPAAAMATTGWWLGYSGLGALLLFGAKALENSGHPDPTQGAFYLSVPLGAIIWLAVVLLVKEKPTVLSGPATALPVSTVPSLLRLLKRARTVYGAPVLSFLRRHGLQLALLLLAIIFLFKIGEAFLGRMSIVFYREIGLDYGQIGLGKLASTVTVCVAAIAGSFISARWSTVRGLLIGGILMAATNLLFAQLAHIGADTAFFLFAVVADQVTAAISTVAFVAFISHLCDRRYAASQYAALASLGNLSRTTLAASSGFMVTALGGNWSLFFVLTALMVLPSLTLLWFTRNLLQRTLNTSP